MQATACVSQIKPRPGFPGRGFFLRLTAFSSAAGVLATSPAPLVRAHSGGLFIDRMGRW
jgi:hypothetical protein